MEDRIDAMERMRRRMLAGFLVAFVAWQVPTIVREAAGAWMPPGIAGASAVLAALAAIIWIAYSLRLWRLQRQLAHEPAMAEALDDERVKEARSRALAFGFWALLVYLAMVRLAAFLLEISAATVAQSGLVVAAAAAIGAFLVYDRG
jgi:hypothetical protein